MNRTRKRSARGRRPRRGVTLIELIVASTILMMGLLAIVGVSASIARSLGQARIDGLAAMAAQSRFERLAGSFCEELVLDVVTVDSARGVTERWVVTDAGNNTRLLTDSVSWITQRATRRANFQTLI
ncbi:MAG: type IV pilus modification PilV family protein, partial [Gemmatimonadaceae bacterium]